MINCPTFQTKRLRLRPLALADASAIQKAASARQVSDTMISLPHPYPEGEAERYVTRQKDEEENGTAVTLVIERAADRQFLGLIEVREIEREHLQAELSFWLVTTAWHQGYMSEALVSVLRFSFENLGLNRLYAYRMVRNPACGRVLERNGFRQEGLLRQRVRKWGKFEDVVLRAVLRQDWEKLNA